ncbi:unnamed protein product [Closterium sp. NIES-54]
MLGVVIAAAGDDAAPAADRQEARPHVGEGVGLHGAVHGPRAAARWEAGSERSLGATPRYVTREQGMGSPRPDIQKDGHDGRGHLLQDNVPGGVEGGAWAGVGMGADPLTDGLFDSDVPTARRGRRGC